MYIGMIGRRNADKITFNKEIVDVIKKSLGIFENSLLANFFDIIIFY